jgi:hypothetical protein
MTLIWRLLPTLRIDLPQTAGVVGVLIALRRPTARRWAVAGVLLGLTILVKETILLLALAPLALVGTMPRIQLARLCGVFLAGAVVVAGWWWIVVWIQARTIFPLNAIGVIERRDVGADLRLDAFGLGLVGVIVATWFVVLIAARRDRDLRLLVAAGICLLPPVGYAITNGLSTRNLAGIAVLSAVAFGVACARIGALLAKPRARPSTQALTIAGLAIGLAGAAAGQARVGDPGESALPGQLSDWLRANAPSGSRAVMTFRDSEIVALELYGTISVPGLAVVHVEADAPLSDFIWIGLRDRQLFGYTRSGWEQTLAQPGTVDLVLAGPHALTPAELMPALDRSGLPGLALARRFTTPGEWASIYRVTPPFVRALPDDVRLHLSPAAAVAWLDLAGGADEPAAARRLVSAAPLILGSGSDADLLRTRLTGIGCLLAAPTDGPESSRIIAAGSGCAAAG